LGLRQRSLENLGKAPNAHYNEGIMKIFITGDQGYVGPIMARHLRRTIPDAYLIGFDTRCFALSTTNAQVRPERLLDEQNVGDVREIPASLLEGIDGVIQFAAISNDPIADNFADARSSESWRHHALGKGCRFRRTAAVGSDDRNHQPQPDTRSSKLFESRIQAGRLSNDLRWHKRFLRQE
jgi:hypothetical protein